MSTVNHAYAVIMAGGRGERFWPLSTIDRPKQLLSLVGGQSLLAAAAGYVAGLIPAERILVVTNERYVAASREALPALPPENIIGEPFGRDTAAASALACALVKARDPQGVVCILTADHIIGAPNLFKQTIHEAIQIAAGGDSIITIGITPTFPSTGFGYIETGEPFQHAGQIPFLKARRFVEKPGMETAEQYVKAGNYFWNSGLFVWSVATFENALARFRPQLLTMTKTLAPAIGTSRFAPLLAEEYGKLEKISVDYAIMEKASNILTAKGTFPWDDVGTWPALGNHFPADAAGNVVVGDCLPLDSAGNVVVSNGRLTALLGVADLVVVQAEGATLVCHKDRAQDVKKVVQRLGDTERYKRLV